MFPFVKIVAFDLETTGLEPLKDEILEIGAVLFTVKEQKDRLVPEKISEFQSFARYLKPIPQRAGDVNKITNEMVKEAPLCVEVLQKFKAFCDPANCLIAHNAPFDLGFLNEAYGRKAVPHPAQPILDSLIISRKVIKAPEYKLGSLAKILETRKDISLRISDDSMHRAVYDCEMLMHVFVALLRTKFSANDFAANEFLSALKKKDIFPNALQIKPVRVKSAGFF